MHQQNSHPIHFTITGMFTTPKIIARKTPIRKKSISLMPFGSLSMRGDAVIHERRLAATEVLHVSSMARVLTALNLRRSLRWCLIFLQLYDVLIAHGRSVVESTPRRASPMKKMTALVLAILVCAISASAQKLAVKIIDRQDNETDYTYVVPTYWFSNSSTNVNCGGSDTNVNCNGSTNATGTITPAHQVSYHVRGATFTLQLPDGRGAIVNCESKYAPRGDYINRRDCRTPLVENIQAEFHGDKAKLTWVVSLDGKKTQSETYKVLAILDKPKADQK